MGVNTGTIVNPQPSNLIQSTSGVFQAQPITYSQIGTPYNATGVFYGGRDRRQGPGPDNSGVSDTP